MIFPFKSKLARWATVILLLVAVGSIFVSYQKSLVEQQARLDLSSSGNVPVASLDVTEFDWGDIPREIIAKQSFFLSNSGTVGLEVTKLVTSCGCTTATLWFEDQKQEIPTVVPPGQQAEIRVEFDPEVMSTRGEVTRAVRIETNDPESPFLIINLYANVQ